MNKKHAPFLQNNPFQLKNARVHEVCGPAATSFAAVNCAQYDGPILWIDEAHHGERILPNGMMRFCDPGRIVFARGANHLDVLWMAEESLRSKATKIVIVRLSAPLSFIQGRRLQLAAEAGRCLGLFLVPEGMGSNTAETRWQCAPCYDSQNDMGLKGHDFVGGDSTLQHWQLIKNKSGTLGEWMVIWNEQAHHINMVSKAGQRPGFARALN